MNFIGLVERMQRFPLMLNFAISVKLSFLEPPEMMWFHLFCCCRVTMHYQTLKCKNMPLQMSLSLTSKQGQYLIRCLSSAFRADRKEFSGHYRSTFPGVL